MVLLYVVAAALLAVALNLVYRRQSDPLKEFPGPYWASWTYLWRLKEMATGMPKIPHAVQLHRQYGDVVRTGPNVLNFSDPQAVKDIYGTDKPYHRSDWYWTFAATAQGRVVQTLFATANTEWHDNLKRAVNPAFSLSALVQYEPFVNSTIAEYLQQLAVRHADKPGRDGIIDLPRWMHWYAFDVVGELTYGKPFGFLRTASDVDNIIRNSNNFMSSNHVVGAFPGLDNLLRKNPVLLWLNQRGYFNGQPNPVVAFALKNRQGRRADGTRLDGPDDGRADLLLKFIQAKERHPETISEREVLGISLSMIFAGSESTGTTLTAIMYYLLKHPAIYRKLQAEIDFVLPTSAEHPADAPASFKDAFTRMPYLDACVKEVFRLHPAARFAPERVLPADGATIAGHRVPGGTVVAVHAWALHRREDIFGADVDTFRPERWLPADGSAGEQARVENMNQRLFHFGAGKFGCIGRNISLLEMYKLIPSLLRKFDFALDDPAKDWRFVQGGFVNIAGVDVRVKTRSLR